MISYLLLTMAWMNKPDNTNRSAIAEKELFILPAIPFPALDNVMTISDVVSCSPSTLGDKYIKTKYKNPDDLHIATIIVALRKVE